MLGERRRTVKGSDEAPPQGLNGDRWLGPAPSHPYNPAVHAPTPLISRRRQPDGRNRAPA